jgi:glutamate synthase (NADPH/NADH) large chain
MGMVELSLVEDLVDMRELENLIRKHYEYTNSPLAGKILEQWNDYLPKFLKIIPYEYKKVLEEEKIRFLQKKIDEMETDVEIRSSDFLG